ncbi:hypothetical protein J27TS7_45180 [Paenibacillus dendritiformis]|nr:hypothetical protein J27TS7_45180 [Paenibacillus dendritiformis]
MPSNKDALATHPGNQASLGKFLHEAVQPVFREIEREPEPSHRFASPSLAAAPIRSFYNRQIDEETELLLDLFHEFRF